MIDFEKIISKYNTKFENKADMTQKIICLYSELCEAISKELAKAPCREFLIPAVSATLEVSARGLMLPYENDKLLCYIKNSLIDGTKSMVVAIQHKEKDNE